MRLRLCLGLFGKGSTGSVVASGPSVTTAPTVSPSPPATEGVTYTATAGVYAPSGGGTVTVVRQWRIAGTVVGTALTYAIPAGTYTGQVFERVETATETGGTSPGVTTRVVPMGAIVAAVSNYAVAGYVEEGYWL